MTTFNHQDGQHIEIDGARIYVEQQGNPGGPALLLLHGGFSDIETFNAITPRLAPVYRLIGIDSRGQGKSTLGKQPLTYRRIQQDAEAVARHLGLGRIGLIGHSDGGIAALRLAAAKTLNIDRVTVIGAHWALPPDDPTREMYAGITAEAWREMFPHSYDRYMTLNPEPDFERLATAVRTLWLDDGPDGYPVETVREIVASLLVIRGDEDQLVSRENSIALADRVDNARLLNLSYADHALHEDRADWLWPTLEHFLREG